MLDIIKLRKLRGIKKQKEISQAIGISQNHYSQIENGIKSPSLEITVRIAQYHGVHVDEILFLNPIPTPPNETAAGKPGQSQPTS